MSDDADDPGPDSAVIGIDLGGTNVRAGLVLSDGRVVRRESRPTGADRGPGRVIETIAQLALSVRGGDRVAGVGIGSPGPLDAEAGVVVDAPNLAGWRDVPLGPLLSRLVSLPVRVENDANAAALGEAFRGAGRGSKSLVCITLGTGIGGGIVLSGDIVRGASGVGGEIGHVTMDPRGPRCGCGNDGCLEAYASATALVRGARARLAAGAASALRDDESLTAASIALAARSGDALAASLLGGAGTMLGIAVANLAHLLNPDTVVFSGGLSGAGEPLFGPLRAEFRRRAFPRAFAAVRIALAELGDDAGIVGAARAFALSRGGIAS